LMVDLDSRAQIGALAVHGYNDGVTPTPASDAATKWSAAARNCAQVGKPLWMTETSGYSTDWNGAFQFAQMMHAALRYGKIAVWVHWYGTNFLDANANKNKKYYVAKQVYRYVRPGAVMYDVTDVSTDGVLVTAFVHQQDRTMTVIAMNANTGNTQLTLTGTGLPSQYQVYRTSSGQNCASQGTSGNTLTLPGNSITTLYATNYDMPTTAAVPPAQATPSARGATATARLYDLRGRAIGTSARVRGLTPGTYCQVRDAASSMKVMLTR
ncbi:MAG: hypothetical protein GF331_01945, partial [Chitinivibrionales bacterium]|nr:hypothetical protein [Chitinivibrionales bacterium]